MTDEVVVISFKVPRIVAMALADQERALLLPNEDSLSIHQVARFLMLEGLTARTKGKE